MAEHNNIIQKLFRLLERADRNRPSAGKQKPNEWRENMLSANGSFLLLPSIEMKHTHIYGVCHSIQFAQRLLNAKRSEGTPERQVNAISLILICWTRKYCKRALNTNPALFHICPALLLQVCLSLSSPRSSSRPPHSLTIHRIEYSNWIWSNTWKWSPINAAEVITSRLIIAEAHFDCNRSCSSWFEPQIN